MMSVVISNLGWSQTFQPTSGTAAWNDDNNWGPVPPQPFPNSNTAAAAISPASDPLNPLIINLNQSISVNTLTFNKSGSTTNVTVGEGTQTLTFDGTAPKLTNGASGTSAGQTIIGAPIALNATLAVDQGDSNQLQFTQSLSGAGGLKLNAVANTGGTTRTIVLGAANSYAGRTVFLGNSGDSNSNYLLVRLENAQALSPATDITLSNAVILGLTAASGDFTLALGSDGATSVPGTFHNGVVTDPPTGPLPTDDAAASKATGWAAFGVDRAVNIGGNATPMTVYWGNGTGPSDALHQNILVLGHATSDKTITFQNPIVLNSGGSNTSSRSFRILDGAATTDAIVSGSLTTNNTNNSRTDVDFSGGGVVSLTGTNDYHSEFASSTPGPARTGATTISGSTVVRLDNAQALSPNTNLFLTSGGILGLGSGYDSFTWPLGAASNLLSGQIQWATSGGNRDGGFAAFGGTKTVNLGGSGGPVTWGSGNFVNTNHNLILSHVTATGTLNFQNPINLGAASRTVVADDGSAAIDAELSGTLIGAGGGLQKNGDGVLRLAVANSYTGTTTCNGGSLLVDIAGALPGGPLVIKNSGTLGLGTGNETFTRSLGAGNDQVAITASGGFAAFGVGSTKVVRLNNDAVTPLVWASTANFVPVDKSLIFSDGGADGTLEFQNPIDLNGSNPGTSLGIRTIIAKNGSALVDGKMTGVLSGAGAGINKSNPGTLELAAANTYTGATQVQAGALLLTNPQSIPGGIGATGGTSNIAFTATNSNNIGVIGLANGDFTRGLGAGANQVQFNGHGGWAAYFGNRVVNLGGASQQVTWGVGGFVPDTVLNAGIPQPGTLRLGTTESDGTVDFQNPIDLNGGARTVSMGQSPGPVTGILSGTISGAGGSLIKSGNGTLRITGNNTYDGGTTISSGKLLVSNTSGSGTGSGAVLVTAGTLGGTGSISGAVTVNSGGHIAPGESIESLAVGSLIVNTGSFLDFELGAPGSPGVNSDLINVINSGGLTLNGGSVTLADAGGLAAGTYTLVDYAGTLGGNLANLGTPTGPAGFTYSLVNNASNTSIDLLVAAAAVGDWNGDTKVNAADFVTWRKDEAGNGGVEGGNPSGYVTWRENFDLNAGAAVTFSTQAVPEPGSFILLLAMIVPLVARRRARSSSVLLFKR
jgi:autotransporter-associated beta strand protein